MMRLEKAKKFLMMLVVAFVVAFGAAPTSFAGEYRTRSGYYTYEHGHRVYHRYHHHSTKKGAVVGGVIGGVAGAIVGGGKGALIGAGAGAGTGYVVQRHRNHSHREY